MTEGFAIVQRELFERLICVPFELKHFEYGLEPQLNIQVKPDHGNAPIMLNRDINSGYWDHHLTEISNEPVLVFLEFFDWRSQHIMDNQYVKIQVLTSSVYPDIVGKQGLIEVTNVTFDYRELE